MRSLVVCCFLVACVYAVQVEDSSQRALVAVENTATALLDTREQTTWPWSKIKDDEFSGELVVSSQIEEVGDIVKCNSALAVLPGTATLRLVFRTLDMLIQDSNTFFEAVTGIFNNKAKPKARQLKMLKTLTRALLFFGDMISEQNQDEAKQKVYEAMRSVNSKNKKKWDELIPEDAAKKVPHFVALAKAITFLYQQSRVVQSEMAGKVDEIANTIETLSKLVDQVASKNNKQVIHCAAVSLAIQSFKDRFEESNKKNEMVAKMLSMGLKATAFLAEKGLDLVVEKGLDKAKGLGGDAASHAAVAIKAAGAIAGACLSILESVGDSILHFVERDNSIKAFRRAVRMNVLSALEGVALHFREKVKADQEEEEKKDDKKEVKKDDKKDGKKDGKKEEGKKEEEKQDDKTPDFKAEDTNCYQGVVHVMHMILDMLNPKHDEQVFKVFPPCVSSKWSEFKDHWILNSASLKIDYPERYSHLLAFVSRRSGFDSIMADSIGFPDNALKDVFSGVLGSIKDQLVKAVSGGGDGGGDK